jgi:hypothetical protein
LPSSGISIPIVVPLPVGLVSSSVPPSASMRSVRAEAGLRRAQLELERHEPLLRAGVQIALDPPPGIVGGGDDPRARGGGHGAALRIGDRRRQKLRE